MKPSTIVAIIVALALVLGGIFVFSRDSGDDASEQANGQAGQNGGNTGQQSTTTTYTLADVAQHATPQDCWLTIEGKVYNVTGFAERHPGGQAVYQGCGRDATELFNTRPMGSRTPHSAQARSFLPSFYIGDLRQ